MKAFARFAAIGGLLIVAGVGAVAALAPAAEKSIEPCQENKTEALSPGGMFRSELVIRTCGWGFGLAAETVDVKVTKLGPSGWFMHVPVEYDSTAEDQGTNAPTVEWMGSKDLQVTVNSRSRTGVIVEKNKDISITRRYYDQ
jgi:hypothetical protein